MSNFTYFSVSKGQEIPLHQMENHHLNNAILKLERDQSLGAPIPLAVLAALKAEQARRNGEQAQQQATQAQQQATQAQQQATQAQQQATQASGPYISPEASAPPVSNKQPASESPTAPSFVTFAADVHTALTQFTEGQLSAAKLTERLQSLAAAINSHGGKSTEKVTPTPSARDASLVLLKDLQSAEFPALTSRVLLNSLATYGVTTLAQLSALSRADFAAVRFSTPAAYIEVQQLFANYGLDWAPASTILINDGRISSTLNPNASDIAVFAREAERRLKKADGLFAPEASIERVMNGVKKRLSLAANALSTSLLVRGLTSEPAVQNWLASLTVSEAFKQQVRLCLARMIARVQATYPSVVTSEITPTEGRMTGASQLD